MLFPGRVSGKEAGRGGLLSPSFIRELGFWGTIYVAEFDLDLLTTGEESFPVKRSGYFSLCGRDVSILVDEATKWGEIEEMVRRTVSREKMEVESIELF